MLLDLIIIAVIGLIVPIITRNLVVRRPLHHGPALAIAVANGAFVYVVVVVAQEGLRLVFSPALGAFAMFMAIPAHRVLRRDRAKSGRTLLHDAFFPLKELAPEKRIPLSRAESISKLREMVADPNTAENDLDWAKDRLAKFEQIDQRRAMTDRLGPGES